MVRKLNDIIHVTKEETESIAKQIDFNNSKIICKETSIFLRSYFLCFERFFRRILFWKTYGIYGKMAVAKAL